MPTAVLAFSGGLDTSFCLVYLRKQLGYDVVTVTVDTGGFDTATLAAIEARARELGAVDHFTLDATADVYDDHIAWLIRGNVRRGGVYPLCVGAERVTQARKVAEIAAQVNAAAIAHGSTGAGNDQIRFDVVFRTLCPELDILTPVRDGRWSRQSCADYLAEHGVHTPVETRDYSINEGLWGVTIGGKETHDSWQVPPDAAWPWTVSPGEAPAEGVELVIGFEHGLPTSLDGEAMDGVALVRTLNTLGADHGVGRGIHLGDTILGIKGRIAFEAPAAEILIDAHRELEKLVLTRWQAHIKDQLSAQYGMLLHEARYLDPVMRDLEAFLLSSQHRVTGAVRVALCQGRVAVHGVRSPYSMMHAAAGTYGEHNALWDGADARGFCTIYGTQQLLAARALARADAHPEQPSDATAATPSTVTP